jgi:hypothetical protein
MRQAAARFTLQQVPSSTFQNYEIQSVIPREGYCQRAGLLVPFRIATKKQRNTLAGRIFALVKDANQLTPQRWPPA